MRRADFHCRSPLLWLPTPGSHHGHHHTHNNNNNAPIIMITIEQDNARARLCPNLKPRTALPRRNPKTPVRRSKSRSRTTSQEITTMTSSSLSSSVPPPPSPPARVRQEQRHALHNESSGMLLEVMEPGILERFGSSFNEQSPQRHKNATQPMRRRSSEEIVVEGEDILWSPTKAASLGVEPPPPPRDLSPTFIKPERKASLEDLSSSGSSLPSLGGGGGSLAAGNKFCSLVQTQAQSNSYSLIEMKREISSLLVELEF